MKHLKGEAMENIDNSRLLKVQEVQDLLNLSRSMVYKLTTSGALKTVRIGKSVRIPVVAVEAYIASLIESEKVA